MAEWLRSGLQIRQILLILQDKATKNTVVISGTKGESPNRKIAPENAVLDCNFTRRLTVIGGRTAPDDWAIFCDGNAVGRVHRYISGPTPFWMWLTWTTPPENGQADTLDEALLAMKAAVLALPPDKRQRTLTPGLRRLTAGL